MTSFRSGFDFKCKLAARVPLKPDCWTPAGDFGEGVCGEWLARFPGETIPVTQTPGTKLGLVPRDAKRPDFFYSMRGWTKPILFDAKFCLTDNLQRFVQKTSELAAYRATIAAWENGPLFFFVIPREDMRAAYLISIDQLKEPCMLAGEPALGVKLADCSCTIALSPKMLAAGRKLAVDKLKAGDSLPPGVNEQIWL